ncbi:hypothetical protein [Natronobacterium texcoconense]|uniref:Uncharacterized protein n=1 Tax=Natronobacterium texcoconense TaxID=1095778 RepID=A0A1H1AJK4_NATTX|nr:hypothetical protein [Natronobacterium texcoconense]SDQ39868.1 hypothetical protein SAMN04489842_0717 [Natronobacterium texcoconense]
MQVLIVDQCSSDKKGKTRYEPVNTETIDSTPRTELVQQDDVYVEPADQLYEGRQQQRISDAVTRFEEAGDDVDRVFISAGFGVVDASESLPLYDVTFSDMTTAEVDERAKQLEIYDDLRDRISDNAYDIIFFALGSDYYRSAQIDDLVSLIPEETFIVLFNSEDLATEYENAVSVSARTTDAKEYGTIVIALKGEFIENFALHRENGNTPTNVSEIERYCTVDPNQSGLSDY